METDKPKTQFLVRDRAGNIHEAPELRAYYPEVYREAKRQPLAGLARMVEGTGRYQKDRVEITGSKFRQAFAWLKPDELWKVVRRLREQEAQPIADIDAKINLHLEAILALRAARVEALKHAFKKGNVVRVNEVKASADARLPKAKEAA